MQIVVRTNREGRLRKLATLIDNHVRHRRVEWPT
jgi:hypothetical protein